jgi:hypothetical protein
MIKRTTCVTEAAAASFRKSGYESVVIAGMKKAETTSLINFQDKKAWIIITELVSVLG